MRRLTVLCLLSLLVPCVAAQAAMKPARLLLSPDGSGEDPICRILGHDGGGMSLEFTLPALELEEMTIGGESYQALGIPGGGLRGKEGQPGLPDYSRLVAVPEGVTVSVRVLDSAVKSFPDFRVLPVQPDDAQSFIIDAESYARAPASAVALVELGEPAYLGQLRVMPVTFSPVRYDPLAGELSVTHRLVIELAFTDGDTPAVGAGRRLIPESFDLLYQHEVLGYDRDAAAETGPGTYLMICPNSAAVQDSLAPLLDWRRRQGYRVRLATTAETGNTTASIKSFIQNVYNTYDPPLEYVVLAGDANGSFAIPCWFENLSGYGGETDHYYSTLAGGDVLSDVHVGRLSYQNLGTLGAIVHKIVKYETAPPTADAGWFRRAGLAGDPNPSGMSCVFVNQWVKTQLIDHGYTQIDTLWSPNQNSMGSVINQGVSAFGYRGWIGMSGMSENYILNLSNGLEMPFAVIVTCDTGSFEDYDVCKSEAFLRAANGGGIGSIGTCTWGTHTRYNNCFFGGAWDGAINGSDHRIGPAETSGKLALYRSYQLSEPSHVEIWSCWNNLMGDPASQMWMAYPASLSVTHPTELAVGANCVPVTVTSSGSPVAGARVALYKSGELRVTGYTDENGRASLPIAAYTAGSLLVTVLKHDYMPYRGSLTFGAQPVFVASETFTVDDDAVGGSEGNGNGRVNPGESIELAVMLRNYGSNPASGVTAVLSSDDPAVSIIDGAETFGNIAGGGTAWSAEDFDFRVDEALADGHVVNLNLLVQSGLGSWTSLIQIDIQNAALTMQDFTWSGGGGTLSPGESGSFSVEILNAGSSSIGGAVAVLRCESPFITVTDPFGSYGAIGQGGSAENTVNPFTLSIASGCFQGHQARFALTLIMGGGVLSTAEFTLPVGTATSDDPTGPDAYGYYAFDNTDTSYPQAPVYNWVEIAPNYGGPGTSVGLGDFGWEQDDTEVLNLPFTFVYYGQPYSRISVCSNGWVAMGSTYLRNYRNWNLPGAGSPNSLIAPYWDNLYQASSDKVFYWNDAANHRYVVQWSRMPVQDYGSIENFELILYDPAYHPTPTGDGEFRFQYAQIAQVDSENGYGTVGMQNQTHSDGISYSYWNQYSPGSAVLAAGRAIRILPAFPKLMPGCAVQPEALHRIMLPDAVSQSWLRIGNDGEAGSSLSYRLTSVPPPLPLGAAPVGDSEGDLGERDFSSWLRLENTAGEVPAGDTADIQVTFDTTDLPEGSYEALIVVANSAGLPQLVPVTLTVDASGTAAGETPVALSLGQNHPNPFNPSTLIRFALPAGGEVRLAIYGINGDLLRTLVEGRLDAGQHQAQWDGRDDAGRHAAAGVYFYRLESASGSLSRKMLLLK